MEPAPSYSYLRQTLPGESALYRLAGGRDGIVPVGSDADVEAVASVLEASARMQAATDPTTRSTELRQLAFTLLGAEPPRLVADGVIELRRLPRTLSLTSEELEIMRRTLRRNLKWAVLYNALALSLSYAGLMTPLLCALLMPASSLVSIALVVTALGPKGPLWRS